MSTAPNYRTILAQFSHAHAPHVVFKAFVRLAACALAAGTREREYLEEAKNWSREDLMRFSEALGALVLEMEAEPFTDLLGGYHMDTLGKKGQD